MAASEVILVFCRNEILGKVKTRLARIIGDEKALGIHRLLCTHTARTLEGIETDVVVFYDTYVPEHDFWEKVVNSRRIQSGDELGERMENAFRWAFSSGYRKAVIIGTDCPGLQTGFLVDAFRQLDAFDAVIGPAADGGYYLLGLNKMSEDLFRSKTWGGDQVLKETLADLERMGKSVLQLPVLHDVDTAEDLVHIPAGWIP